MNKVKQLRDIVIDQNIKIHAKEAPIYETIHPQIFNWYHNRKSWNDIKYIFNLLDSDEEIQALDLGCGTGFLTMKVLEWEKARITAVDLSKEMLSVLENKISSNQNKRISLINGEAVSFLQSNTILYDIIMTSALLHHLVDIKELLGLIVNKLKSGGILYIAYEPLKQQIDNKIRFIFHRMIRQLDVFLFNMRLKMLGITIEENHEKSMADYQTTMGGIDPIEVITYLKNDGVILKYDKFATRANGFLAFISDKIIKSQNTFSFIFKKT